MMVCFVHPGVMMNRRLSKWSLVAVIVIVSSVMLQAQIPLGAWSDGASMPTARKQIANATVTLDSKIYAIGGVGTNGQITDAVEVYDPDNNDWTSVAPLPLPLWRTFSSVYDGKIYTFGGYRTTAGFPFSPTNRNFVYDPQNNDWAEIANLSRARGTGVAVNVGDRIHILGGVAGADLNLHEIYDPTTDTWSDAPSLPTARSGLTATVLDGNIYVMGGYRLIGGVVSQNNLEIYNVATETWSDGANMPSARHGIDAVALNGLIYVFGGQTSTPRELVYDPETDAWTQLNIMPQSVTMAGVSNVDGLIYIIGGGPTGLNPMNDGTNYTQIFDPNSN
jgi:N-acetylneuraminic acid mutarotase